MSFDADDSIYVDDDGRQLSPEEIRGYLAAGYTFEDAEDDGLVDPDEALAEELEAYGDDLANAIDVLERVERRPLTAEELHTVAMAHADGIPGTTALRGLYELTNRKPPDLDKAGDRQVWMSQRMVD